jgi:NitT/TauT family transport system permease protein/taurine transport system permease protein
MSPHQQYRLKAITWRVLPAAPFVALLVGWSLYCWIAEPAIGTLPPVGVVAETLWGLAQSGELLRHAIDSLGRLLLGVGVGVVTGVAGGFLAGLNRGVAHFLNPLVIFFNALSGIVWLPLVIGWLGIGTALVVFLIWNTVFFLVFQNTVLGVQLVPEVLEQGVQTLGAGRLRTTLSVTFPGALPYIPAGIRAGLGFGWRALIAAELVGATSGLGQMIFHAAEFHRADIIIGGCIVIGAIAMAMDRWLLLPLERRTVERWGLVTASQGERLP